MEINIDIKMGNYIVKMVQLQKWQMEVKNGIKMGKKHCKHGPAIEHASGTKV